MSAQLTILDHLEAALEQHLERLASEAASARERVRLECELDLIRREHQRTLEALASAQEAQRLAESRLAAVEAFGQ